MSHNQPERHSRAARMGVYLAVFVVAAASAVILVMNIKVREEISEFASAKTDSQQWTLAQFDVELLALQNAIAGALHTSNPSLVEVRRRYDIFYSRVNIIRTGPPYFTLIESGSTADKLSIVEAFLSAATPIIDAADQQLVEALPDLAAKVEELRPVVRNITLSGITHFSGNSDLQREGVASLLTLVSTITSALIVVLLLLLVLLLRINRQARKKSEEQSQMRSRLQAVVSTSLDAVIVADLEGRILDFNEAAEEIFGYPRAEAIGALMEELIVPEHLVDAHRAGMDRYRKTGKPRVIGKGRVQLEGRRKSGEVFPVELSISSARSAEGEIFVSFLRDISPRVAAEKELIKARDDAVAGERAKADFLAVMSHEMRTPLNGLLGTLELLDMEAVTDRQRNWLDIIRSSGQQLLFHVNNVLDISRADAGKIETVAEEFSLTELVSELVESQRALAEHRGNLISYAVSTNGHDTCVGDPDHLRQILLNLIANAVKFTREGRITVTADRSEHDAFVEFRITDTGIGIDDDDQARIFEDFVTLDTSYGRSANGTGLGLGIARRLVHTIGGEIGVESVPGSGSVFWVRVPLPEADLVGESPSRSSEQGATIQPDSRLPSMRVLLVEDNRINRVVASDLLQQEGMDVDEAHDGELGVKLAGENSYDLILMDISMPVLDGVEATRAIRDAESGGRRVPIIALTAHALPVDRERFLEAGMNDILIKPISRSSVRAVLQEVASRNARGDGAESDLPGSSIPSPIYEAQLSEIADTLGEDRFATLLTDFDDEMENALKKLSDPSGSGKTMSELASLAHHAAGSAAMLGARALRAELIALEETMLSSDEALENYDVKPLQLVWKETQQSLWSRYQSRQADQNKGSSRSA